MRAPPKQRSWPWWNGKIGACLTWGSRSPKAEPCLPRFNRCWWRIRLRPCWRARRPVVAAARCLRTKIADRSCFELCLARSKCRARGCGRATVRPSKGYHAILWVRCARLFLYKSLRNWNTFRPSGPPICPIGKPLSCFARSFRWTREFPSAARVAGFSPSATRWMRRSNVTLRPHQSWVLRTLCDDGALSLDAGRGRAAGRALLGHTSAA